MRVARERIIDGIISYVKDEIIPKMEDNKGMQIMISVALNTVNANKNFANAIFNHDIARILLDDDGSGTYDISGMMNALLESVKQYGFFPLKVPAIPLLSPVEFTLKLNASDVEAMRRRIEDNGDH